MSEKGGEGKVEGREERGGKIKRREKGKERERERMEKGEKTKGYTCQSLFIHHKPHSQGS